MQLSTDEFMKLHGSMTEKDIEIALLKKQVEELRNKVGAAGNAPEDGKFITFNVDHVCEVLEGLRGKPGWVSFLYLALQKMMPEGMPVLASQRIQAAASLESLPINLMANGDIRIDGNDKVNL